MNRFVAAFILSALVILTTVSGIAGEPMQLVVNEQTRTFLLERPAEPGPRPTIIVLHGSGSTGAREAQSDFGRLAPQAGFVAVFPDGRGGFWNHLPPGKESAQFAQVFQHHGGAPDDVAFLKALVADLVQRGISNPKQVFLAGTSAGGIMALRMVCMGDGTFAAIALMVASMPEPTGANCRLSTPLPVLMISGTADDAVPYGGGPVNSPDPRIRGAYSVWSAERLVAFFRQHNGCAEPAEKSVFPGQNPEKVEVERSIKCSGGRVDYYRVVGGRHNLRLQAPNPSQLVLDFFRDKPAAVAAATPATPTVTAAAVAPNDQATCFKNAVGDDAVAACGRLIASNTLRGGDFVRTYLQRAVVLARRGDDYDRVIADASEILRLDPNNVSAYLLRGMSYQRKNDSARAQVDVSRALQLGPKSGLAYNALSAYYNMTGEYERALVAANESLRISPGNLYGRKNRAESLENKGELEKALADFRAVFAADPQRQERAGRESAAAIQRIEQKLGATRSSKSR